MAKKCLLIVLFVAVASGGIIPRNAEKKDSHHPLAIVAEGGFKEHLKPVETKPDASISEQTESEEKESSEVDQENGKAPVAQILPFFGDEEVKREPQLLNGFGQHQEASNGGGIEVEDGYFGFGHYSNPVHPQEVPVVKREPQLLNGFGQHQEASNGGGITVEDGYFGFGGYLRPQLIHARPIVPAQILISTSVPATT